MRPAPLDEPGVLGEERVHFAINSSFKRLQLFLLFELGGRERFKGRLRAVRENDVQLLHIFFRLAVAERALPAGIVRHDAAHGGYFSRCRVGGKHEAFLHRRLLKVPIKYAGFCHRVSVNVGRRTSYIDVAHAVHVLSERDDDTGG